MEYVAQIKTIRELRKFLEDNYKPQCIRYEETMTSAQRYAGAQELASLLLYKTEDSQH